MNRMQKDWNPDMNTRPKIADYTTRKRYQKNYAWEHRIEINKRKKLWRKDRARSRHEEDR